MHLTQQAIDQGSPQPQYVERAELPGGPVSLVQANPSSVLADRDTQQLIELLDDSKPVCVLLGLLYNQTAPSVLKTPRALGKSMRAADGSHVVQ